MDLGQHLSKTDEKQLNQKTRKIVARIADEVEQSIMADAFVSLAVTLEEAIELGVLEEDMATEIYNVWRQKLAVARGELKECGCGNMLIRRDLDYADSERIRHTNKWCDVIPSDEDVMDMEGLEDPDTPDDL